MKNALIEMNKEQTMTLKEITDLLDVRHNDAMEKVTKMAEIPEFGELRKIRSTYKNNIGATLPLETYQLNKRQSMAVAARLNTALLMRVIDRWQELESVKPKELTIDMMIEAYQEQKLLLAKKDEIIIATNQAQISAGEILVREFVKANDLIDIGEKQFFAWLRAMKIISESNEPYQEYVKKGYFSYKPTEDKHGGKFRYQLRITPRGKVWLAAKYLLDQDKNDFDFFDK